jgi:hypothetical protein
MIFFGLPFLPPDENEDSCVEEMISEVPTNERCTKFSNYLLETYVDYNLTNRFLRKISTPLTSCKLL